MPAEGHCVACGKTTALDPRPAIPIAGRSSRRALGIAAAAALVVCALIAVVIALIRAR
jgi:hypothetical protein